MSSIAQKLMGITKGAAPAPEGWDLSRFVANFGTVKNYNASAQDTILNDVFFKPDGTKMYTVGDSNNSIYEYNLSTAWTVGSANFVQSFSVGNFETTPGAVFFKPDGTRMYVVGSTSDRIHSYNLSTAWDISTASRFRILLISSQESIPRGLFFRDDGLKMYVVGSSGVEVNEYDLPNAWDTLDASFVQNSSLFSQDATPQGVFFKPDGLKMYVVGSQLDNVYEYNLSDAWNVTTLSFVRSFNVTGQDTIPTGIFFKPDGTRMYVSGTGTDSVYEYDLSTPWNISTASYNYPVANYFSVASQETLPWGVFFKPDGTKMYIAGDAGNDINEYDLSTPWDISTASYLQIKSISVQDQSIRDVFFKPDGTKMFTIGEFNDRVYEYDLSTAWDVSTALYSRFFFVAQDTQPRGLFFKPDGLKMYVVGVTNNSVYEYDLSIAWSINSLTYLQSFSVSSQDTFPSALAFKPDGTKMYVLGATGDSVYEYDLSSAWNVSTAIYTESFSVGLQETGPTGLTFEPDGTSMYVVGTGSNAVWRYTST
jgi:DNA-binding beta-propeller fold protein YncE